MPNCSICSIQVDCINTLIFHIAKQHSDVKNIYNCGELNCYSTFSTKDSFKKHLQRIHDCQLNSLVVNDIDINLTNETREFSNSENLNYDSNTQSDFQQNTNNPDFSANDFKTALNKAAVELIANMYANLRLSKNIVQHILDDIKVFLSESFIGILESKVENTLINSNCSDKDINVIKKMFDDIKNTFADLDTEHRRLKHFEKSGSYIKPKSYIIDRTYVISKSKKGSKGKMTDICGQFIPLRATLKKFFQQPNALTDTVNYMEQLKNNETVIENYIQCKSWAKKRSEYKDDDIVIPYFLSGDDVEVNNPLGSRSGKVMPIYASIPCLPSECRSKVENYFLVLLYDSWIRLNKNKKNRTFRIYRPLIKEIKFLEEKGIKILTNQGEKHVYFVLGLIQGDNLGLHGLLGFTESFSATYYCRFCKMDKNTCQNTILLSPELTRTVQNYKTDLKTNNITLTGIREKCVFNSASFYAVENFSVDEMHDFREGIAHDDLIEILSAITSQNSEYYEFSVSELNERLAVFDYGPIDSLNKPPFIRDDDLSKNNKLKMTASELTTFVRLLGVIIGDLVSKDNPYWQLYLILREIFDFILAKKITNDQINAFDTTINRHWQLYKQLTGNSMKPKGHISLHYKKTCEESGPCPHLSSIRAESKHTNLTVPASVNKSRVNICKSIAIKHQLNLNYRFLANRSITDEKITGIKMKINSKTWSKYNCSNEALNNSKKSFFRWVEYKSIKYTQNMVLITGTKDLCPTFALIELIISLDDRNELVFVCRSIDVLGFNEHVWAYEVKTDEKIIFVNVKDLLDPFPLYIYTSVNNENFIVLKDHVC
ncbi:uncharacterized protein LOC123263999 [Cotesia glomerata]|uniref:uncharacterized protein LOC123263999 n=1 Tax=Cotesia glomerata TaxID=32391 RepID=UPI001D01736D|nr:uncharacterized protein LOC123263999 [Cotesia glomerata]